MHLLLRSRLRGLFTATAVFVGLPLSILECAGRRGETPLPVQASSRASSLAAPKASPPSAPPSPSLTARLDRRFEGWPNVFSPKGDIVGLLDERCEGWDVATGLYRGVIDRATCVAWQEEGRKRHAKDAITICASKPETCKGADALSLSPSGDELAAHRGGTIDVYDAKTGAKARSLTMLESVRDCGESDLAWNDDMLVFLCRMKKGSNEGGGGVIAKIAQGKTVTESDLHFHRQATTLLLDPWGNYLLTHDVFQTARDESENDEMWSMRSGQVVHFTLGRPKDAPPSSDSSNVPAPATLAQAAFSADARTIALAKGVVIRRGKAVDLVALATRNEGPQGVAISPDGARVALVTEQNTETRVSRSLVLRRMGDDASRTVRLPDGVVQSIEFSGDGRHVAVLLPSRLEIRNAETGAVEIFWARVSHVAWGPDATLAVEQEGRVQVRDLVTRAELFKVPEGQTLVGRAFAPAGELFATVRSSGAKKAPSSISLFNAVTGKKGLEIAAPAATLVFSADGKTLASGATLGDVVLSSTETGNRVRAMAAPELSEGARGRRLTGLGFVSEGRSLVGVDEDGRGVLWDVTTGAARRLPERVQGPSSLSPSGDLVVDRDGDLVRLTDGVRAHVTTVGVVVDGGCFTRTMPLLPTVKLDPLADRLGLVFGDSISGTLVAGSAAQAVLGDPACAQTFFAGAPQWLPPALASGMKLPPQVKLGLGKNEGGALVVPIHVVDRGGGASTVTIEALTKPSTETSRLDIPAGGTPLEGKPWVVPAIDGGPSKPSLRISVTACNVGNGGLCAAPLATSVTVAKK